MKDESNDIIDISFDSLKLLESLSTQNNVQV